ncbi:MAG: hypothetical protein JWN70_6744 [Planctomycetaceae bacterium]|nr:hypothetical protein [Planctomycetaceae bacterium]
MKNIAVALSMVALSVYGIGCAEKPAAAPTVEVKPVPGGAEVKATDEHGTTTVKTDDTKPADAAAPTAPEEKKEEAAPAAPEEKKADEKPAEEKPAEEKKADEKPAEEKPAEEKKADEKPAEEKKAAE